MKRIFDFIIDKKYLFLTLTILVLGISFYWMGQVTITDDVSSYLPSDSEILIGLDVLEEEFGTVSTLKVVIDDLEETEKVSVIADLSAIDNVIQVMYENTDNYNVDNHTLFVVYVNAESTSKVSTTVMSDVEETFSEATVGGQIYLDNQPLIPTFMLVMAFIILMVILFLFTSSWIEPFIFLITIGIAILINLGTNIMFDSITSTTFSIAALLQLCLSIDYSIILLNRYRQEKAKGHPSISDAMKKALHDAFPSIAGSSFTTIVGLLCLLFMSFQIGTDLGLVLAKGVFISMLSVFFVLPTFILIFDKLIERTKKPALHIGTKHLSTFSFEARKVIPILFLLLFIGGFFLRGTADIGYILPNLSEDKASTYFPDDNTIVLLYDNDDEGNLSPVIQFIYSDEHTIDVSAYQTTIGAQLTASELSTLSGFDEAQISGILMMAGEETMSIYDFLIYVQTNMSGMLTPEQTIMLQTNIQMLEANITQMIGDNYSRVIITTTYPEDSEETYTFMNDLKEQLSHALDGEYYLLGNAAMATEISSDFNSEFLMITLITIVAIFVIVALTFKSISVPVVLVSIIQTAIFITMGVLGISGDTVYFLAILIVQAILMGATIDYGILFTSYLKQENINLKIEDALDDAYHGSIHTILTSSSILFFVTGIISFFTTDSTITQILRALAVGTLSSTLLILFVLPSTLVLIDRWIRKSKVLNKI